MAMPKRSSKLPRDPSQISAHIAAVPTGQGSTMVPEPKALAKEKNPAAVALGRLGGIKGGKARAEKLTSEQRKNIATRAAQKRWERK